ncbi:MAG: radical SAM protein [Candidatus Atribacteria bacterium]|nr:radical SAM protein [Candidatus Atribacteria bacterium]
MRVLLIYPLTRQKKPPQTHWIPLGLSFIASSLRKGGHTPAIFDRHARQAGIGIDKERMNAAMMEGINQFHPDLIGFNTVSPLIYDTSECIDLIKKKYPAVPLIAGGHHASALPALTLEKIPGLRGVIVGEGERALTRLADGDQPPQIPGVWWKNDQGNLSHSDPEQILDLDSLPFPAFDLLDMSFYTRPTLETIRDHLLTTVSILTSRGCPYHCSFCSEHITYGRGVRYHSPEYVREWIQKLYQDYRMEGVYFHDNDFLIDEERARAICHEMIHSGLAQKIKWAIQTRASRIQRDLLPILKEAGCISIEIGIESFQQNELDQIDKHTLVQTNRQAIAFCRESGISVHAYLLSGFSGETLSDWNEKLKWIKTVKPNSFQISPLTIFPSTSRYQQHGHRFFETNQWDEKSVVSFFAPYQLSLISPSERKRWIRKQYIPYARWHRLVNLLQVNPPGKSLPLVVRMTLGFIRRHLPSPRGAGTKEGRA